MIPDKIIVLGKVYKIILDEPPDNDLIDIKFIGRLNHKKGTILIDKSFAIQRQLDCLIHEMLHAISYDLELNFDEPVINRLSSALFDVLVSNNFIKLKEGEK